MKKLTLLALPMLLFVETSLAHCPLCTIGAGAAAAGAAWLGISKAAIGVFIGGFAVSMGWWFSRLIKKQFVPFQKPLLIVFSFVTTVGPLLALLHENYPLLISIAGEYGTLLNRTYVVNMFLVGSIIGGFIVSIAPWLSEKITSIRHGRQIPFQGITITFVALFVASIVIQLVV